MSFFVYPSSVLYVPCEAMDKISSPHVYVFEWSVCARVS